MKSWYVIVMKGYETLLNKKCLTVKEANDLLKAKKEEYPASKGYSVIKESY
jgi:hypothetical protein